MESTDAGLVLIPCRLLKNTPKHLISVSKIRKIQCPWHLESTLIWKLKTVNGTVTVPIKITLSFALNDEGKSMGNVFQLGGEFLMPGVFFCLKL